MNKKNKSLSEHILKLIEMVNSHHTGAYAAQAAYFLILSIIPIIIILLTLVQFTPLTREVVMEAVVHVFPTSIQGFMTSIVNQAYNQSGNIIPVTVLVAIWSAGKGVMSISNGLNLIYDNTETRNYLYVRIRASLYTVFFIIAIVLSLILSVFGNSISELIYEYAPLLRDITEQVMELRTLLTFGVLTSFWAIVYKYLPNRTNIGKTTFRKQMPGALFTACGWMVISFFISVYLDVFTGFSTMYGSLTMLILIMLWLYMCMYVILLGGELNAMLERYYAAGKSISFLDE